MESNQINTKKHMTRRTQEIIFLCTALAIPLTQFFLMYVCVNFNSILLAFREYTGDNEYIFAGLKNFSDLITSLTTDSKYQNMLSNSLLTWFVSSPCSVLISLIIAYSVWKKVYFSGFFSTVLFMPSILSSIVFVMIARVMVVNAVPLITGSAASAEILQPPQGFYTLLFYDRILSFGISMIYFMGAMSAISTGLVEYGKLEGVNAFQEFIHIVFPAVYPTVVSLLVVGFAQIFTNMGLLLAYYGVTADYSVRTFGYHIYITVKNETNYYAYPSAASMGLLFTAVTIPIVFTAKYLLEKFGPRED